MVSQSRRFESSDVLHRTKAIISLFRVFPRVFLGSLGSRCLAPALSDDLLHPLAALAPDLFRRRAGRAVGRYLPALAAQLQPCGPAALMNDDRRDTLDTPAPGR